MNGFEEMGFAKWDYHRPLRNGLSEVVFCEGKSDEHLMALIDGVLASGHNIFGTRASEAQGEMIKKRFNDACYDPLSRTFGIVRNPVEQIEARLTICAAGTADLFVAEEARLTAAYFGIEAKKIYDVGIAGLHRLMHHIEEIRDSDCVIAVAGMEGALPSLLGGLIEKPIIAVPTSVGYGTNFKGITALLAMLNSCSEGIAVVNVDNGFGAACAALRILKSKNVSG